MIYILIGLVLIAVISAYFMANYLLTHKRNLEEMKTLLVHLGWYDADRDAQAIKKDFEIVNSRNEKLLGEWWLCGDGTNKVIVLCHGFGFNRVASRRYAAMFNDMGFDCLLYDHIHAGISEGKYSTMAKLESEDLKLIVDNVKAKNNYTYIGVCGESMGGATVLRYMARNGSVDFVIADCPYASLKELIDFRLSKIGILSKILLPLAKFFVKIRSGLKFEDVDIIKDLNENKFADNIPLLLVHGDKDETVPLEHSIKIKDAKRGYVNLYICKGANHAEAITYNKQKYIEVVCNFFKDNNIK